MYLMTFSYDGSGFIGYQKQKKGRSVQEEIENALTIINNNSKVFLVASGRTDKGVHAINQKAHFKLNTEISLYKLKKAINSLVNNDIYVKNIIEVNEKFHARFDVLKKEYKYKINVGEYNPLERNYVYQYNKELNIPKIKEAILYFKGKHNFKSFVKSNCIIKDYNRIIYDVSCTLDDNIVTLKFVGNGFMRYMVRNMVGFLIAVGKCEIESSQVENVLKLEDRTKASVTAPACGLYLENVFY